MGNNKVFTLIKIGKTSFCYCYRRFLPSYHRFKNNRKDFLKDNVERNITSPVLSGEEVSNKISRYKGIIFGFHVGMQKFPCFGVKHNWIK
jgi:hypothetical protein